MKKKNKIQHKKGVILFIIIVFLCIGVLWGYYIYTEAMIWKKEDSSQKNITKQEDISEIQETEQDQAISKEEETKIMIEERIMRIKKRNELKELILDAESYIEWGHNALALKTLLDISRENPDDTVILTKIAETYFDMKRFGASLNYYNRLSSLTESQRERVIFLELATLNMKDPQDLEIFQKKIWELKLSGEEIFYYTNSLICKNDSDTCVKNFEKYFSEIQVKNEELSSQKLKNIQNTLINYKNFWLEENYLRNTFLISEWFKVGLYPFIIDLWEKILQEKPNYKPVLLMLGQAYFELNDFENAKKILTVYLDQWGDEPWVNYMLGVIHSESRDLVLANIFFNKALENGYTPTLNLRRSIVYNFSLLEDTKNILLSFKELIEKENDYEKTDLMMAIYTHIIYGSYKKALYFIDLWHKKYPEETRFYAYEAWALRERWDISQAIEILTQALEKQNSDPFLLLQLAYALKEENNLEDMKSVLEDILALSGNEAYKSIAKEELNLLP